ncbi:MAG: bifunctional folylpolyglutamate synthase/dihydrofolate synthase [Candidatus Adiutrix sp.]|jgi:dihydrofolate synthase/folylpolyglutamate synthase|nr:bifunctional folylpolyglutamate synthase/dihydrofolate synthase [Candidatus Adiutrix sp.]
MSYKNELQKMFDLQKFGMKFGLDGMKSILRNLGDPHAGLKCVHLAGTNGKGSVGVMLTAMLARAGYRVGFYTSPHLGTFRERIKIGDALIGESEVLALSERVWRACDPESPPTFFEFVTAMAFLHFKESGVDVAVIEAGLGGRLDSTNVIEPLVSVITNVSLEHTEQLGDTVAKIASEKAGIIKPGVPLVTGKLAAEAEDVIRATAAEKRSPVLAAGRDFTAEITAFDEQGRPTINFTQGSRALRDLKLNLAGPHQADNAAAALAALAPLAGRGFTVGEAQIRDGLAQAVWPGRAENFAAGTWPPEGAPGRAPLILDGAHNPDGARALGELLSKMRYGRLHLIVGVMADKDIAGVLGPVYAKADRLYLSRPVFKRAASPELLLEKIRAAFGEPTVKTTLHPDLPGALAAAAAEAEAGDLALLSGSLFTVGEGRAYLTGFGEVESN